MGTTTVEAGGLVADSGRNEVILDNLQARDVRATMEMKPDQQGGILVRYQDPNNYVLAFHERVDGNWGGTCAPVPVGPITATRVRLTVELIGNQLSVILEDGPS
ncbi:MAG: hypothetical protein HY717_10355 [Planctomycetes bacterium]|nr:hypothetical protein [Planctomycetota bacterium]